MNVILPRLFVAVCVLGLAGCVEAMPDFKASAGDVRASLTPGGLASPRAATVAIASLSGAPDAVATRFDQAFAKAASARDIAIADVAAAHYLVRGYLAAVTGDNGTDVTFVYDIFDANDQQRIDRVTDTISVPASGADPWAQAGDGVIASLAGRSADALASALAQTPVAKAASASTQTAAR